MLRKTLTRHRVRTSPRGTNHDRAMVHTIDYARDSAGSASLRVTARAHPETAFGMRTMQAFARSTHSSTQRDLGT